MKIGLFFGSFNPIHHGHLIIAQHILNQQLVDKIWFIVSPQNPLKETVSLLNEKIRLYLLQLAVEGQPDMLVSDVEFKLHKPSYTSVTLAHLTEKYPEHDFYIIMGGDSIQNLKKWKNYTYILDNCKILVYNRPEFEIPADLIPKIQQVAAPLLAISATMVRDLVQQKKSIRYLLPDVVIDEIEKGGYYKSTKKSTPSKGRAPQ